MDLTLFDYRSYRDFLRERFEEKSQRGAKTKLAAFLGCEPAFVSRVLSHVAHFSPEHAIKVCEFLQLSEPEEQFFMLLVQYERAGSARLSQFYALEMQKILTQRKLISERLNLKSNLDAEAQLKYYGTWHFSAIHVLLLIPELQTRTAIARHLHLPEGVVAKCLEFLEAHGLVISEKGRYRSGQARIHLPADSPMVNRHHSNWRLRAVDSLEFKLPDDLHYSGPLCLSRADAQKVRAILLNLIQDVEKVVMPSKEEVGFCLNIDWFEI